MFADFFIYFFGFLLMFIDFLLILSDFLRLLMMKQNPPKYPGTGLTKKNSRARDKMKTCSIVLGGVHEWCFLDPKNS